MHRAIELLERVALCNNVFESIRASVQRNYIPQNVFELCLAVVSSRFFIFTWFFLSFARSIVRLHSWLPLLLLYTYASALVVSGLCIDKENIVSCLAAFDVKAG